MFVGHYAASLALKSVDKKASLGMLFLAVQFVDILFFPFVLLGIEHLNIVEHYTQSTHFELVFMPYTHGLFASVIWAVGVYIAFRFIPSKETIDKNKTAGVMAIAVLSHWVFDLIVHTPDLPLLGDNSTKFGFGLWNDAIATFSLESLLLLGGLGLYLKSTTATTSVGKYGMIAFVTLMIIISANNIFGAPIGNDIVTLVVSAVVSYSIFAGVAFWLDGKRN